MFLVCICNGDRLHAKLNATACCFGKDIGINGFHHIKFDGCFGITHIIGAFKRIAGKYDFGYCFLAVDRDGVVFVDTYSFGLRMK